jgi:LysM repeat protein
MGSVKRSSFRQYFIYLGLNVVVSAATVLLILSLTGGIGGRTEETATPTIDLLAQVASSFPTDTATLPPTPTPLTYQVQPGDTLGDIATRLGVPLQDLMEINDIDDPNALDVGQVLIIPVSSGSLTGQDDSADTGDQPPTATPEPESSGAGVIISAVYDSGDLQNESIRLFNTGGIVRMEGWTIEDGEGRTFIFPDFTFYSTGAVNLHTRSGVDTSIDLFWGLDEAIWEPGKVVSLKNADGDVISTFPIPDA